MKNFTVAFPVLVACLSFAPGQAVGASPAKQKAVASIDRQAGLQKTLEYFREQIHPR